MTAFDEYLSPARARTGFWRPILGLIVIMLFWFGGMLTVLFGWTFVKVATTGDAEAAMQDLLALTEGGGGPVAILVMLASFWGVWLGVFFACALLHGQSFGSVFAPGRWLRGREFARGALIGLTFSALGTAIGIAVAGPPEPVLAAERWALFALPVALLVCIQATAEELVFRGYLLQQLAARSRSWIVWGVLPSLVFGLLHLENLEGEGGLYYVAVTFLMGVALAVTVYRTGSLWTAIGLHVAVNIASLTGITVEGPLAGTQAFLFFTEHTIPLMQVDLALTIALLAFVLSPLAPLRAAD